MLPIRAKSAGFTVKAANRASAGVNRATELDAPARTARASDAASGRSSTASHGTIVRPSPRVSRISVINRSRRADPTERWPLPW